MTYPTTSPASTREGREQVLDRILANLEADLRVARTTAERTSAVDRAASTLDQMEPPRINRPPCASCGEPVRGVFAQIDFIRYCHDPEEGAMCYRDEMNKLFSRTAVRQEKEQDR